MHEIIYANLTLTYEIIKYIQELYLKYKQIIKFKSFEICGKGIDTIYRLLRIKSLMSPVLMAKIKIINKNIYLLPLRIITILGIWTFITEPTYITYDLHFTQELYKTLNLKYILPYTYCEKYGLLEPMFIINNFFDSESFNPINLINLIYLNPRLMLPDMNTISKIYNFEDFINITTQIFNDFIYGPDIVDHIFDNFIDRLILTNKIDDKKKYFKEYKKIKNKKEYISIIKEKYKKEKKFYNKRDMSLLFYFTQIDAMENH